MTDDGSARSETGMGLPELVELHLLARSHRDADPDTGQYHAARATAAGDAFGIFLDKPPGDDDGLAELLEETLARFPDRRGSPFDAYLEAPMPIVQLHRRYSSRITQANALLHETLTALAVDIIARLWRIYPDTTVSWDELAAHGFERSPLTPDPLDEW